MRVSGKHGDRRGSGPSERLHRITKRPRAKPHLRFKHLRDGGSPASVALTHNELRQKRPQATVRLCLISGEQRMKH